MDYESYLISNKIQIITSFRSFTKIIMSINNITITSTSPILVVSNSPTTPKTSILPKVNFYLPYPSSTSSSSSDESSTFSATSSRIEVHINPPFTQLTPQSNSTTSTQETPITKPRVRSKYRIMADDDSSSVFEDFSDTASLYNKEDDTNIIASNNTVNLSDMAKILVEDTSNTFNLSDAEQQLVSNSTVNTKKYEKTKNGVEQRFFDTIEKYGNETLKQLLPFETRNNGIKHDRIFF
jgi:hypothetical protein